MKIFKKKMDRRDFLKYSLISLLLLGIGSLWLNFKKKNKKGEVTDGSVPYGKGVYGG